MPTRSAQHAKVSTRERILKAAVLRFSRHSYESVGLREIAGDVGVDVAYVHRCFGSKEKLFAEAVAKTARIEEVLADSAGDPAKSLARQVFAHNRSRGKEDVVSLDIVIRSLTSQEATRVLRGFALSKFIDPLADKLDHTSNLQAALITALLLGVGICRDVLTIPPLCKTDEAELESEIADVIKAIAKDPHCRRAAAGRARGRNEGHNIRAQHPDRN
jgi:AcrR family transcriptional regulator